MLLTSQTGPQIQILRFVIDDHARLAHLPDLRAQRSGADAPCAASAVLSSKAAYKGNPLALASSPSVRMPTSNSGYPAPRPYNHPAALSSDAHPQGLSVSR